MARIQLASLGAGVEQNASGSVRPFAPGTITRQSDGSPITIWSARTSGTSTPGTFTTDALGRVPGWVDRETADYEIVITVPPAGPVTVLIPGTARGVSVQDAGGTVLPTEQALQFTGSGVSVADDAGNARTVITVAGGGGGGGMPGFQKVSAAGLPVTIAPNATTTFTIPVPSIPETTLATRAAIFAAVGLVVAHSDISKLAITLTDTDSDVVRLFVAGDFPVRANLGDASSPDSPDSPFIFTDWARPGYQGGNGTVSGVAPLHSALNDGVARPADAIGPNISGDDAGDITVTVTETGGISGTVLVCDFYLGSREFVSLMSDASQRSAIQVGAARGVYSPPQYPVTIAPSATTSLWLPDFHREIAPYPYPATQRHKIAIGLAFTHPHPEQLSISVGNGGTLASLFDAGDFSTAGSAGAEFGGTGGGLNTVDAPESMIWFADGAGQDWGDRRSGVTSPRSPLSQLAGVQSPQLQMTDASGQPGFLWYAAVVAVTDQWLAMMLAQHTRIANLKLDDSGGSTLGVDLHSWGHCLDITAASAFTVDIGYAGEFLEPGAWMEICQMGVGQIGVTSSSYTLLSPGGLTHTRARYSTIRLRRVDFSHLLLSGDLA